jgi:immune inhibitor A
MKNRMTTTHAFCLVPPSPEVLALLHAEYRRYREKTSEPLAFKRWLERVGFKNPTEHFPGGDTGDRSVRKGAAQLVQVPSRVVAGNVQVIALLVDFPDKPGHRPASEYEDMLFSKGTFLTGSMRDYYSEVSLGKVDVTGTVHGWLRMPNNYAFYVDNQSGLGAYPHNAQKLTQDAIAAALAQSVTFPSTLDNFGDGTVTAFVVVHAGKGAVNGRCEP